MDPSRQGVDLNCATQLWPLPFDGSNAPLKKKEEEEKRPDKAGEGICGYENVTGTKPSFSLLLAVITIPCPVPFFARNGEKGRASLVSILGGKIKRESFYISRYLVYSRVGKR